MSGAERGRRREPRQESRAGVCLRGKHAAGWLWEGEELKVENDQRNAPLRSQV